MKSSINLGFFYVYEIIIHLKVFNFNNMFRKKIVFMILPLVLISCKKEYDFWDINKFQFKKNALKDNEEIKLLYTSNGLDENKEKKYYYHLIVVSQESGDTVNVLTASQNGFNKNSGNQVFNFYDEHNIITIITQNDINLNSLDGKNSKETEKLMLKKINKVSRDIEYDNITDNNYPTVIGSIGMTTDN